MLSCHLSCDVAKALSCWTSGSRDQAFLASFRSLPARFPLLDKLGLGFGDRWVKALQGESLLRTDTYRYVK